jgi:hypothetical protein
MMPIQIFDCRFVNTRVWDCSGLRKKHSAPQNTVSSFEEQMLQRSIQHNNPGKCKNSIINDCSLVKAGIAIDSISQNMSPTGNFPSCSFRSRSFSARDSILISHSPPRGLLDEAHGNRHVGCDHFLAALKRVKPVVAVFGHIHEARGTKTVTWDDGSSTLLYNAANYSHRNGSVAPPTYFTINLPSPSDC